VLCSIGKLALIIIMPGGRDMEDAIGLPDLNDIESWLGEQCYLQRARLRNELAFIHGDRARGGPPRDDLAAALKALLAAIAKRLEAIDAWPIQL
jgi:hypothetical protein